MKKYYFFVFIIPLFITSCTEGQRDWLSRFFEKTGSAVPVAVEKALIQERPVSIVVPAKIVPSEEMEVRLPYEAHVERVMVNTGDFVRVGDLLCKLSDDNINLRLSALRAEASELQSTLETNIYFLRNRDRLLEEGRIDKNRYDKLEEEVQTGETAIDKIKAQITEAENQTTSVNITSPVSGIIQTKSLSAGMVVPAKQPIFTIVNVNPVSVIFSLVSYEAKAVKVGMPVNIKFRDIPGEDIKATITSVGSQINEETGRFDVRVSLANPNGAYKVGMLAQVEFESAEKQKFFSVPAEAVISDNRRHYVFTVSMRTAHKVPVVVREIKEGRAEVVEGLVENDILVVKGNKQLQEGSIVDIWGR